MVTHEAKILYHLQLGLTITQSDAINYYACYRLSAIIYCLRKKGYHIRTHIEKNTYNKGTHARYELISGVTA